MYHVYFLQSLKNGKVYVGSTAKLPTERLNEHNHGSNAWTKLNRPFKLIYYERYVCKEDAVNKERYYKTGFGKSIKKLIVNYVAKHNFGE